MARSAEILDSVIAEPGKIYGILVCKKIDPFCKEIHQKSTHIMESTWSHVHDWKKYPFSMKSGTLMRGN